MSCAAINSLPYEAKRIRENGNYAKLSCNFELIQKDVLLIRSTIFD